MAIYIVCNRKESTTYNLLATSQRCRGFDWQFSLVDVDDNYYNNVIRNSC